MVNALERIINNKEINTAIEALCLIAHFHGVAVNIEDIKHRYDFEGVGLNQTQWLLAA